MFPLDFIVADVVWVGNLAALGGPESKTWDKIADIAAWKYVNLLSIRELFFTIIFFIIIDFFMETASVSEVSDMTWKLSRKEL